MRTAKAPARCYALIPDGPDDVMEAEAIRKARKLWPSPRELRIDRIYRTAPRFVMYEVIPEGKVER